MRNCSIQLNSSLFYMWNPITLEELNSEISISESELRSEEYNLWKLIRISPEKWQESDYGDEGGGFWAVGLFGKQVIWYNDIEDGFNISDFSTYGTIDQYWCNQDELFHVIYRLYRTIQQGDMPHINLGGPEPVNT
jgi:hypothetical protein